ncbi:FAD-dependent oxidoreductase [Pectobacteriaceae bacterium CE70]|uniref:CoA-disulfide reductase n=1 Tax=Serratia sp. (strain ATCC 39006) TaxID=104623 RepID=E7BBI8_SERS3|nr:FAD-dependent oxidoreductase [Serratia sp. ATCC 39006]WJV63379.1 FAD-dependent oxidoreductase [Pectobacteriaceae bacterium C52]WJV67754.1 FAD-dependent oxidoreductase [Pectobacteriaceae bacterium CE70]WJY11696.1 FAD-dependent oxidoreductase [Pectobacteriaceae bacterium C80]AUH01996.1 CoA-disulfide reductase [Serratia sp. ATCC 39006]AUH06318.1 CoA-disulfide reductase [Serratia sp. ATCC 39006]
MSQVKIIIVGGVAGGASAAVRARRLSETAEIILLERGAYVSFANCGLPYHISGEIPERQQLLLKIPQDFTQRFNIDVRIEHQVLNIDAAKRVIQIENKHTGEIYSENYDQLLLSTGASPIIPPLPGITLPGVFTLRTIPDMDNILAHIRQHKVTHATVVGGGFIGLEMMESLVHLGLKVTLLELSSQVMASIDIEMASALHQVIRQKGVDLRLQSGLSAIKQIDDHDGLQITLSNTEQLTTGMVLLAIGVKPDTQLANSAGLTLAEHGGIQVDEFMRTSDPHIYAVGDVVETAEWVTGNEMLVPLAGPANRQGRIAAENMLGGERRYQRSQGTAICKVFDHAVGSVGLNEKALGRLQMDYQKVYIHTPNHASYYPGSSPISFKLLFNPITGDIFGAQAVGKAGIDKCIDVIAVAQRAHLKVQDLEYLELAYAPPFNSARDVVNQAGMLASNVINGDTKICHVVDIVNIDHQGQCLLDIRTSQELKTIGTYPEALHIPVDELRGRLNELPKDKEILIGCQSGLRGHVAYRLLTQHGFRARNLSGGYKTYSLTLSA